MFCRNCGNGLNDMASICPTCGVPVGQGNQYCNSCGGTSQANASVCTNCGVPFPIPVNKSQQKSKMAAGLLGIFLGSFGVHNFYLGYTTKAVIQLILTFVTCGLSSLWGFIEGILILTGNINVDANGVPLSE